MKNITGFHIFVGIIAGVVLTTVIIGLFLAGSPTQERMRRLDQQRASHLVSIANSVDAYWSQNNQLPPTVETLQATSGFYVESAVDPESGIPYEYRKTAVDQFQLCAVFQTDSSTPIAKQALYAMPARIGWPDFARHHIGKTCFSLTVQKTPGKTP